ncbi:MAG: TetR family transcriptional regulator [Marinobacter sp.]|uniref:TetR/AcrR family transcriptional regulator n=1 Tax=Marinobacter sp. TaxID=50741 RepID=UPI00299F52D6|nr:TetR family transcriptional regulator [Marinobacter sp.]MDX1756940.1 TetR family transcriptional regulator [Marinobacter sp.]
MPATTTADSTRQKLLLTALELFAERGLDGVSLRTISAESGTRNSAAAHYHFGNRLGLIDGVLTLITDHLKPRFESAFRQVERAPSPTLRDIVQAMCAPYLSLLSGTPPWGSAALRFMAHLHADNTQPVIGLLNEHFRVDIERIEAQLHRVLPDIDRGTLRIRLGFTFVSLIHGAAEIHLLSTTPFGDIRPDDATLFNQFVDYVEGGLSFGPTH